MWVFFQGVLSVFFKEIFIVVLPGKNRKVVSVDNFHGGDCPLI
jgi:hypothetical protein